MRRFKLLLAGLAMAGFGGYLIFANPQLLPLWFIWLTGPILWYVGIAVCIVGAAFGLFAPSHCQEEAQPLHDEQSSEAQVLQFHKFAIDTPPARLAREIPAMGGFIM